MAGGYVGPVSSTKLTLLSSLKAGTVVRTRMLPKNNAVSLCLDMHIYKQNKRTTNIFDRLMHP